MNESEHPMKSIAVKGLPSSRFFEQQDTRMFSSRQLYGFPIKQRTIAILARSNPGESGGGTDVKRTGEIAVLSEFDSWAKKHPNDASMMGGFLFFRYLQTDKSDLLDFRSGDNKWPIVHGWIRDSVEKIS